MIGWTEFAAPMLVGQVALSQKVLIAEATWSTPHFQPGWSWTTSRMGRSRATG